MKTLLVILIIAFMCKVGHSVPIELKVISASNETIEQQLKDIGHLLPKDLIRTIANDHLKTDDDFKAAIKYMQSPEWVNLVEVVRDKPEWIALKKYLREAGLNIDVIIRCVETFAQNVTVELEPKDPAPKKSFRKFIIDVEQNIPTVKILSALHEKMAKGQAFQKLFEKLSSEESRVMIEKVIALPEVKRMMNILADMDVNLYDMFSLMYTFFGWGEFKIQ